MTRSFITRRRATIALHWLNFVLVLMLVAGGPNRFLAWLFVATGLSMVAIAALRGLMNGPGPKLQGILRTAHPWMSIGMYAFLGLTALLTLLFLLGLGTFGLNLGNIFFYLMATAVLHAIFHIWRDTSLGDGAFRRMLPRALTGAP